MNRKKFLILNYIITVLAIISFLLYTHTYKYQFIAISLILILIRSFIFIPRFTNYYNYETSILKIIIISIIVPLIFLIQTNENINIKIRLTIFIIGIITYSTYYFYLIKKDKI